MKKLLFVISNGFEKAGRATRAFQFAQVACEEGHGISDPGVYKVHFVAKDVILFELVEDDCRLRVDWLAGPESRRGDFTWTKVKD